MKKKVLILFIVLVLFVLAIGCESSEETPKPWRPKTSENWKPPPPCPEASMSAEEVINIVFVYGVPHFPIAVSHPTGKWAAVYEGNCVWRIVGTMAHQTSSMGETSIIYLATTWTYTKGKVTLKDLRSDDKAQYILDVSDMTKLISSRLCEK